MEVHRQKYTKYTSQQFQYMIDTLMSISSMTQVFRMCLMGKKKNKILHRKRISQRWHNSDMYFYLSMSSKGVHTFNKFLLISLRTYLQDKFQDIFLMFREERNLFHKQDISLLFLYKMNMAKNISNTLNLREKQRMKKGKSQDMILSKGTYR